MNAETIATVKVGDRVSYEDMSNPLREGVVTDIDSTPWGVIYGVLFDSVSGLRELELDRRTATDLRQHGWKMVAA